MPTPLRAVIVEDLEADAELMVAELRRAGFEPDWRRVENRRELVDALAATPDVVLADFSLPTFSALDALECLRAERLDVPLIVVSGSIGEEVAVECIRAGAHDYLLKDRLGRLGQAVSQAVHERRLQQRAERVAQEQRASEARFARILEASPEAIIAVDESRRIALFNASAERIFGYTSAEAVGLPVDRLLPPAVIADPGDTAAPAIAMAVALDARRKDGFSFPAEASISRLIEDGRVLTTVMLQDVTERRRAAESLAERTRRLEALGAVTSEITRELDLGALLEVIVRSAADLAKAEVGVVRIWDPRTRQLPARAWIGIGDWVRETHIAPGQGVSGAVAVSRERLLVNDYPSSPYADPAILARVPVSAALGEPLLYRGELLGVLTVNHVTPGRNFSESDVFILSVLANQAAIAIQNARLYAEAARRRHEAEELGRLGRVLAETLDVDEVAARVVRAVPPLLGASAATLRLLEADGTQRVVASVWPKVVPQATSAHILAAGAAVAARAIAASGPFWTADVLGDARLPWSREIARTLEPVSQRALLSVPLVRAGRVLGVINVACSTGHAYSESQITLLRAIADQAALAMENALLHADTERRRREAEVIAEVAAAINGALDLDVILQRVTEAARDLCDADSARIALRGPEGDAVLTRCWVGTRGAGLADLRVSPGRGTGGQVLLTHAPFRTASYADDPRITKDFVALMADEGFVAELVVPIFVEDVVEGLIYGDRRSARPFSDRDEATLQRLADHAAIAVRNTKLFAREGEARSAAEISEARYRSLLEGSIQGVLIRQGTRIRFANAAAALMFGYDGADDLVGADADALIAPADRPLVTGYALARHRGEPSPTRYDHQAVRRDGSLFWLEVLVSPARWDGEAATLVTLVDISERKQAEETLRQREEELRQAQKMEAIGQLAGGVAHDFNNLLTVITGRAEMMLRELSVNDPLRHSAELVERTAARAANLTRQLLAFSRKQVMQPRVLDLNLVVHGLGSLLRRLIGEDVELDLRHADGLGQVSADRGQIEQVLMNLAVNARDAMPRGGRLTIEAANVELVSPAASHAEVPPGAYVALRVTDTGEGMDAATRARIFEPFFTTKEAGRGTGLGLSTVYGIVKQSGGDIAVESEPGQGTRMTIYLPRIHADSGPEDDGAIAPTGASGTETILIVEDEPEVRELVAEVLRLSGYVVITARDVEDAQRIYRASTHIDLVITDVVMPGMSGRELADRLAAIRPGLRVLYMSGYTDSAIVQHGVLEPDTAFVQKPFTPASLARKVRDTLNAPRRSH